MQRRKSSRIVSSDFPTLGGRNQGTYILQSHGTNVSRGDLITQDNIIPDPEEPIEPYTITIDKDTYASLCQQATSWEQAGDISPDTISGSIAVDNDGIYASSYGSGSGWHGPVFYATLPSEIGKAGQYWHIVFKFKSTHADGTLIMARIVAGFSSLLQYSDTNIANQGVNVATALRNSSTTTDIAKRTLYPSVGSTNTYTYKLYHYENNTNKLYINDTLYNNQSDPFVLNKGNNIVACPLMQYSSYAAPYIRVQEITVSTDPTYDPQP